MGSDYPHGEGFARPAEFAELVKDLSQADQQKILRDNALVLIGGA